MFSTLYSRLALTLFLLLCVVGLILIQLIGQSSHLYQQEVSQKLNSTLAQHIVAEHVLIADELVNKEVLDQLFHDLMVINPAIELYLLDRQGVIKGYNAPEGKVKRTSVGLRPVLQFFDQNVQYPLKGDDPRNPDGQKVFSAARISNEQGLQGYLYIVLAGEQYDDVAQMLASSYIFESSLQVLVVSLLAALVAGLMVFGLQTRRLRLLANVMRNYSARGDDSNQIQRFPEKGQRNDEVDILGRQFNIMADRINEQIDELRQTDSMRRELVANISHDLRTPLTTMRGYLETLLLKHQSFSQQEQEQYIKTALRHSKHLGKLVEQLFELARLDSCESVVYSEPFSMGELVQDVTQSYQLRARQKSIQLDTRINPEAPLIYADIAMMQRVLENLLENGLRHTPEGGRINITVDVDSASVVVRVADNGHGIAEDDVPRIFERYYQQDNSSRDDDSAGLGLAIVKRILELHGSVIQVSTELNHGTTFSFSVATKPSH
jgi:signal transduction histidine kinase